MVSFDQFLNQAWDEHGKDAAAVAARLPQVIRLLEKPEQVPALARLLVHVTGEHLGDWAGGIALLRELARSPLASGDPSLPRSQAILEFASGARAELSEFTLSERIIILATVAAALSARKAPERAAAHFHEALRLAQGLPKEDPANRSLAVTGNNLACALEENRARAPEDTALMILAAETGRKYWEIAGTWNQVQLAEYRLSMTFLQAGSPAAALDHAQACLRICEVNKSNAFSLFYAFEAIALCHKALDNRDAFQAALKDARAQLDRLAPGERPSCEAALKKLSGS